MRLGSLLALVCVVASFVVGTADGPVCPIMAGVEEVRVALEQAPGAPLPPTSPTPSPLPFCR